MKNIETLMSTKIIPIVDQRTASHVPVIPVIPAHPPAPGGVLPDTRGRLLRDLRISISNSINALQRPLLSWGTRQRTHSRLGIKIMNSDKMFQ